MPLSQLPRHRLRHRSCAQRTWGEDRMMFGSPPSKESANSASAGANLQSGHIAPAGIYVVSHRNPCHVLPHEISIAARTALPECRKCGDVRFSFKCALPPKIEESEFFGLDSIGLAARARSDAREMRSCVEKSRSLLTQSKLFLDELGRSVHSNGRIFSAVRRDTRL